MLEIEGHRPIGFSELIIKNWKNAVQKDDLTIHLGDVIFKEAGKLDGILEQIPGRKILVRGNHDKNRSAWYMKKGFDFVCNYFVWKHCLFSHIPMVIPSDVEWNIHGHFHNNEHRFWEPEAQAVLCEKHLLFALEETNYRPILLDHILQWNEKYNTLKKIETHGI